MAIHHAEPGEVIDVRPFGPVMATIKALLKTDRLEVVRMVMPAGKEPVEHRAADPVDPVQENLTV